MRYVISKYKTRDDEKNMTKYKISVSLDGENFFWIVVDRESLIKNPTEEDLKDAIVKTYSKTNICPICIKENEICGKELTDKSILYPRIACKEKDKNGNKTGRWICHRHSRRDYQRYDPNSQANIKKSVRSCRTGNQDPNSNQAKGDNYQELTHIWTGAEDLNKKNDNYNSSNDHGPISKHVFFMIGGELVDLYGKIPQTKGKYYDTRNQIWAESCTNEYGKVFDYLIFYCTSEDGNIIERIYFITKKEIEKRGTIAIYKNPSKGIQWYKPYRITDKEVLTRVSEIWSQILENRKKKTVKLYKMVNDE